MSQEYDVANENELAKLLNENNSLEKSYLKQLYQHIHQCRPIQIRNVFAEVEEKAFKEDNMMNSEFLNNSIHQYISEYRLIQNEIDQLSFNVENQRQYLRQIICEIDSNHDYDENVAFIEQPDVHCSEQVESLVREIAYSIDDVDEEELVQYLARGPAKQSEQELLEKTNLLCEKRYELKQLKMTKKILKLLNDKILALRSSENSWEQEISPDNYKITCKLLSNAFDEASFNISQISSENQPDEDSSIEQKWEQLQQMAKSIKEVRDQLFNAVKMEDEIPLPQEFTFPEKEKEALEQTLDSLIESNRLLTEYLQKIREHGLVDSIIYSPEEARSYFDEYNELKQRVHE